MDVRRMYLMFLLKHGVAGLEIQLMKKMDGSLASYMLLKQMQKAQHPR